MVWWLFLLKQMSLEIENSPIWLEPFSTTIAIFWWIAEIWPALHNHIGFCKWLVQYVYTWKYGNLEFSG